MPTLSDPPVQISPLRGSEPIGLRGIAPGSNEDPHFRGELHVEHVVLPRTCCLETAAVAKINLRMAFSYDDRTRLSLSRHPFEIGACVIRHGRASAAHRVVCAVVPLHPRADDRDGDRRHHDSTGTFRQGIERNYRVKRPASTVRIRGEEWQEPPILTPRIKAYWAAVGRPRAERRPLQSKSDDLVPQLRNDVKGQMPTMPLPAADRSLRATSRHRHLR